MKTGFLLTVALIVTSRTVFSQPTKFRNDGLSTTTIVTLEVKDKTVTGTFQSDKNNDDKEPAPPTSFTGNVLPTPKGKRGVYLEIHFAGEPPYDTHGFKKLVWYLKIVEHRAHLFIPVHQRNYEGRTPRWEVSDMELAPDDS